MLLCKKECKDPHLLRKASCPDKDRLFLHLEIIAVEGGVHSGTHEDHFYVRQTLQHTLREQTEDVTVDRTLVDFVWIMMMARRRGTRDEVNENERKGERRREKGCV